MELKIVKKRRERRNKEKFRRYAKQENIKRIRWQKKKKTKKKTDSMGTKKDKENGLDDRFRREQKIKQTKMVAKKKDKN